MPIEQLLQLLTELRDADIRLATTAKGSAERREALANMRRIERLAFADVLRSPNGALRHREHVPAQ